MALDTTSGLAKLRELFPEILIKEGTHCIELCINILEMSQCCLHMLNMMDLVNVACVHIRLAYETMNNKDKSNMKTAIISSQRDFLLGQLLLEGIPTEDKRFHLVLGYISEDFGQSTMLKRAYNLQNDYLTPRYVDALREVINSLHAEEIGQINNTPMSLLPSTNIYKQAIKWANFVLSYIFKAKFKICGIITSPDIEVERSDVSKHLKLLRLIPTAIVKPSISSDKRKAIITLPLDTYSSSLSSTSASTSTSSSISKITLLPQKEQLKRERNAAHSDKVGIHNAHIALNLKRNGNTKKTRGIKGHVSKQKQQPQKEDLINCVSQNTKNKIRKELNIEKSKKRSKTKGGKVKMSTSSLNVCADNSTDKSDSDSDKSDESDCDYVERLVRLDKEKRTKLPKSKNTDINRSKKEQKNKLIYLKMAEQKQKPKEKEKEDHKEKQKDLYAGNRNRSNKGNISITRWSKLFKAETVDSSSIVEHDSKELSLAKTIITTTNIAIDTSATTKTETETKTTTNTSTVTTDMTITINQRQSSTTIVNEVPVQKIQPLLNSPTITANTNTNTITTSQAVITQPDNTMTLNPLTSLSPQVVSRDVLSVEEKIDTVNKHQTDVITSIQENPIKENSISSHLNQSITMYPMSIIPPFIPYNHSIHSTMYMPVGTYPYVNNHIVPFPKFIPSSSSLSSSSAVPPISAFFAIHEISSFLAVLCLSHLTPYFEGWSKEEFASITYESLIAYGIESQAATSIITNIR